MGIDKIVSAMQSVIDKINIKMDKVPPTLLYCTAIKRSGGSPMKTTSEIIDMLGQIGFPTGKNEDGSENMVNQAIYCVTKGIYNMVASDMVGQGATIMNSMEITGFTADGAAITASNANTVTSYTIMH